MTRDAPSPPVWLLLGDKAGDNAQLEALGARLGIAADRKTLRYRAATLPNPLKGAALATLDKANSSPLAPPWPGLVIASGRRSVPVARWIKAQSGGQALSGGKTRLVHLGRPRASSALFDLVITTPQYGIAPAANVIELAVPFTPLNRQRLADEAVRLDSEWQALAGPRIAVLVGGESTTSHIGPELGAKLGRDASRLAGGLGGALMILAGRRCLPATLAALAGAVRAPHRILHAHPDAAGNPYAGVLGLADAVIVTADSASMIADGLVTGKPVLTFDVPGHPRRLSDRLGRRLAASPLEGLAAGLAGRGWISLPRQMDVLCAGLARQGLVTALDDDLLAAGVLPAPGPRDDLEDEWDAAARRVARLIPRSPTEPAAG